MTTIMRMFGFFHGAMRPAAFSAAVLCLACVCEAAVPEAAARQSDTGEYRAVVERLVRLERELNDLQRATYSQLAARRTGSNSVTDGGYAPTGPDQQRLSDLEAALRVLTGRLEQLEYQVRQLDAQVRRMGAVAGPAPGSTSVYNEYPPLTPLATSPQSRGGMPEGAPQREAGSGAPRNLAATMPMPAGPAPEAGMPGALPSASAANPDTAPAASRPAERPTSGGMQLSGDEGRDFNTARDLLLRGEFARAGEMFGAIVKAYPKSKLAGDSQFWKAESLFVRELYRDAAEAYLVVARDFPDSTKAPDSLVKLSLSFDKLGQRKQACAALAQLDRRYPKAPEKVRQNAERIRNEFSCA